MSIEVDEGPVTARERPGPALYFTSTMPPSPRAVIGLIHGYADHGARYRHVMGALAEHGIGTFAIDLRGHGRAEGVRGYCERFDEFLDDAGELRRLVATRAKGLPTFLMGHSFGGVVATHSVLRDPASLRGLLLSSPFFGLALEVPRVKVLAARVASRLYPKLALPTGLSGAQVTHDAAKAREYDSDPLVFANATARWFTEVTAAQERALASAGRLRLPLHVTFGSADPIASFATGKRFFDAAGSSDKVWDPREGLLHETLNEPSWKDVVDGIARFVLAHA